MTHRRTNSFSKILCNNFVRNLETSLFVALILSQQLIDYERYSVAAISPRSISTTSAKAEKFGAFMERQPESIIAPLYDEVLFECGLNLVPDRIEWRFRPQKQRSNSVNSLSDYTHLNAAVCYCLNSSESLSS